MKTEMKISFGVLFVPVISVDDSVSYWKKIEAAEFDAIWLPDHYYNIYQSHSYWLETWAMLAHMSTVTERIRIGTLVSSFIYHNPAQLARQAVTVDHLSKGRLTLGLGAGSNYDLSHSMTGIRRYGKLERHERFQEGVLVIDKLLRGETVSPIGNYYPSDKAQLHPASVYKPKMPLLLAAHQPSSLKFAARYADIWNTTIGNDPDGRSEINILQNQIGIVNAEMQAISRENHDLVKSLVIGVTRRKIYGSNGLLAEYIEECINLGINDFIFPFWLNGKSEVPVQFISSEDQLMEVARTIGIIRRRYNT